MSVESEVVQKETKKLLFNFDTSKYELIRTDTMKGWEGDDEQPVSYSLCKKEGKPALLLAYDYYKNKDMEALSTQRYNEMKEMAKDAKKFDEKEFMVTKEKGDLSLKSIQVKEGSNIRYFIDDNAGGVFEVYINEDGFTDNEMKNLLGSFEISNVDDKA